MSLEIITQLLIILHKKYSSDRHSDEQSQMCTLWSIDNPPDVLECTEPYYDLVEFFDYEFTEDELVEFYDRKISDAAKYILQLIKKHKKS